MLRSRSGLLLALVIAAALRAWGINESFVHPLDSAFQESLALNHLKYGLKTTRGLAATAVLDGKPIFHAAHPPLLQLVYAGLYSIFGAHEWVSRAVSLLAALIVIICLWASLMKAEMPKAAFVTSLTFAIMPLSLMLGRTTNYEPLSLAFISLILVGYLWREKRWGVPLMCAVAVIGGLFEWTVYLAFPALLIVSGFDRKLSWAKKLKPLFFPALLAGVTLLKLFLYQHNLVEHIPVLEHASVRSNPAAVSKFITLEKAMSVLKDNAVLLVLFAWGMIWFSHKKLRNYVLNEIIRYYLCVPILFFALAFQLVLTHPIAQYYFAPVFAVGCGLLAEAYKKRWMWVVFGIVFVSFLVRDKTILQEKADFHYNLAKLIGQDSKGAYYYSFDSSAVGYLRFYHGIETIHPLGGNEPSIAEIVLNEKVKYLIIDTLNPEVDYVRQAVHAASGLSLKWRFPQTEVWERGGGDGTLHLTNDLGRAELPAHSEKFWENPEAKMLEADGEVFFGIFHHSRMNEDSTITFRDIPKGQAFVAEVMLDPAVCGGNKTDGVEYFIGMAHGEWKKEIRGKVLPDNICEPKYIEIDLTDAPNHFDIMFGVKPVSSAAYDRLYWIDPRIMRKER